MDRPEIPVGDYYDLSDSESLQHETAEEAVEAWLEMFLEKDCDVSAVIDRWAPVKMRVFNRGKMDNSWIESRAEHALELVSEWFSEDFGDPNGLTDDGLGDEQAKAAMPLMVAALKKYLEDAHIWHCEEVGSVTLDAAAIEAMMREYRPDYWEDEKPKLVQTMT